MKKIVPLTEAVGFIGSHTWFSLFSVEYKANGLHNLCIRIVKVVERVAKIARGTASLC